MASFLDYAAELRNTVALHPEDFPDKATPKEIWYVLDNKYKGLVEAYLDAIRKENISTDSRIIAANEIEKQVNIRPGSNVADKAKAEQAKAEEQAKVLSDFNEEQMLRIGQDEDASNRMRSNLSSLFQQARQGGIDAIDAEFIPMRKKAISEEAALGRLRSPVSIASIGQVDANRNRSISQLIAGLADKQASEESFLERTLSNNSLTQRLSDRDFLLKRLGLQQDKDKTAEQIALDTKKLNAQIEANYESARQAERDRLTREKTGQKDTLDKVQQGTNIASDLSSIYGNTKTKTGSSSSSF